MRKRVPTVALSLVLSAAAVGLSNQVTPRLTQFDRTAQQSNVALNSPDVGPAAKRGAPTPRPLSRASRITRARLALALAP